MIEGNAACQPRVGVVGLAYPGYDLGEARWGLEVGL